MIYYANPCSEPIKDAMSAGELGCIITPNQRNINFPDEWDVMADNGCFANRWTEAAWSEWLRNQPRTMRFAVAPDLFDPSGAPCHEQTLERWNRFGPMVERWGFTPAFVCQVGSSPDNVPDAPVLFLGGTTEWKLGPDARAIVEAHRDERWIHMGRVNSRKRWKYAESIGCHSVDGTFLTFAPDTNLDRMRRWFI